MENKKLTVGIIITLLLAMSGTYYIAQDDDAYYCESRDMVMLCDKLSSGVGTRCYFEETYKTCKEGWSKLKISQEIDTQKEVPKPVEGNKWSCSSSGCVSLE